jgi:hypothetical protein
MDMADLEEFLANGAPSAEIAEYLCRELGQVEAKIASLRN